MFRPAAALAAPSLIVLLLSSAGAQIESARPAEGLRDKTPQVYALHGARVVSRAGEQTEAGVILIRDGLIERLGSQLEIPPDARHIDLSGKTVYPGFFDAWSEQSLGQQGTASGSWNPQVHPERKSADAYEQQDEALDKLRQQGITARLVAPAEGIIKGFSALVRTGGPEEDSPVIADDVALHIQLTPATRSRQQYPNSPMGAVALVRQTLYDAQWYRRSVQVAQGSPHVSAPPYDASLEALAPIVDATQLVIIDAPDHQYFMRADRLAREFGLQLIVRGAGDEYQRLDAIRETGRAILLPVAFPKPPDVTTSEGALGVTLEDLMHWDLAPSNPRQLAEAGVRFAWTTDGLKEVAEFLPAVRRAVQSGLDSNEALRALTETPARFLGVASTHGVIAAGYSADLVVCDGDLFDDGTKVVETWVRGKRYRHDAQQVPPLEGVWQLTVGQPLGGQLELLIRGRPSSWKGSLARNEQKVDLEKVRVEANRLTATLDAEVLDRSGTALLSVVVTVHPEQPRAHGHLRLPDGQVVPVHGNWSGSEPDEKSEDPEAEQDQEREDQDEGKEEEEEEDEQGEQGEQKADEDESEEQEEGEDPDGDDKEKREGTKGRAAGPPLAEVNFPLGAYGRAALPPQPARVAFEHATIWTCSDHGVLHDATLLVGDGKILAVGTDVDIPEDTERVDARGRHITPGIIDCHSHIATDGGINESTQAITAEVRIGDFVDATDMSIYRQLAGGVTMANVLHGSANPIGGQNQVIKFRWGALPDELKFDPAPAGIKFALGENVKQSNWGDSFSRRYPQTRMGVPELIRDAFLAAREYGQRWEEWEKTHQGMPPRRDLELEALLEVLQGKRWVHCHSYRQDEILALLRVLEEFDVQVGTLQHILEGYKVADELRDHGAMASSFTDWWAYKIEVYDAIPYNGALMHHKGIVVSFNSDDAELGRHLNHEAAKAVKYGGVEPEEALKFVTLHPARQLRVDAYVGSLEPEKHADFVVWSGPPLSTLSRCEQTWVDGRKFFDRQHEKEIRQRDEQLRWKLVQKVLGSGEPVEKPEEREARERDLWPRHDEFCPLHNHGEPWSHVD